MACDACAKRSAEAAATQAGRDAGSEQYWVAYNKEFWAAYAESRENEKCQHQTTYQRLATKVPRR